MLALSAPPSPYFVSLFSDSVRMGCAKPPNIVLLLRQQHDVCIGGWLIGIAPVLIVVGDLLEGRFDISLYQGGDEGPSPPVANLQSVTGCKDWRDFEQWQANLRASGISV